MIHCFWENRNFSVLSLIEKNTFWKLILFATDATISLPVLLQSPFCGCEMRKTGFEIRGYFCQRRNMNRKRLLYMQSVTITLMLCTEARLDRKSQRKG